MKFNEASRPIYLKNDASGIAMELDNYSLGRE